MPCRCPVGALSVSRECPVWQCPVGILSVPCLAVPCRCWDGPGIALEGEQAALRRHFAVPTRGRLDGRCYIFPSFMLVCINLCFHVRSRFVCNKKHMCIRFGGYEGVHNTLTESLRLHRGKSLIFLSLLVRSRCSSYASKIMLKHFMTYQCVFPGFR